MCRSYFRHFLHAVTTYNALFEVLFSHSKNFNFACCLGGFHLWFALNLLKYALFCTFRMLPCVSRICPGAWFCLLCVIYKRFTIDCCSVCMNNNQSSKLIYSGTSLFLVSIYLFKFNNKNTRKQCEICPKLTKRYQNVVNWEEHRFNSHCSGVFLAWNIFCFLLYCFCVMFKLVNVRPLNSHGFTVCHTVSLSFSWSHGRFFIFHGFTNFKWIFSQTHNFLRTQNSQHNSLSKKFHSIVLYIQKNNNSMIFDSETSTRSCPANSCSMESPKIV